MIGEVRAARRPIRVQGSEWVNMEQALSWEQFVR